MIAMLAVVSQAMAQTSTFLSGYVGAGPTRIGGPGVSSSRTGRTLLAGAQYALRHGPRADLSIGLEYANETFEFNTEGPASAIPENVHFFRHGLRVSCMQGPVVFRYHLRPNGRWGLMLGAIPGVVLSADRKVEHVVSTSGPNAGDVIEEEEAKNMLGRAGYFKYALGLSRSLSLGSMQIRASATYSADLLSLSYGPSVVGSPALELRRATVELRLELLLWKWSRFGHAAALWRRHPSFLSPTGG